MFLEHISQELKNIRYRNGWSLEKAEEITGINKDVIKSYEDSPQYLKLGDLFYLLEKYNVDSDIFFKNIGKYIYGNN